MRRVFVQVPRGRANEIIELGKKFGSVNTYMQEVTDGEQPYDLVTLHVGNKDVQGLISEIDDMPDIQARLVFSPHGIIAVYPPPSEAPQQVVDLTPRSSIEIFLSALMSVGSWKSYLGYAVAAGIIVWIGIYTNTTLLLVAAVLIAPFAGPAMKFALGTARGDDYLLKRSLARYVVGLLVTITTCAVLSLLFQQNNVTPQMQSITTVTSLAIVQPLVTGAAGALNLVQSENSSLVPGTAVGALIAAALTPPAGVIGMAIAMGMWNLVDNGIYLLVLQLVGINLAGTIVFWLYGLRPDEGRYKRGKRWYMPVSIGATLVVLAGLLTWQFSSPLRFQRGSREQTIASEISRELENLGGVSLIRTDLQFVATQDTPEENTLVATIWVERRPGTLGTDEDIQQMVTQDIQQDIKEAFPEVRPLVNVVVLESLDIPVP